MSVPILTLYLLGIVVFILGIESDKKNAVLYFGLSFAINLMAYLVSYGDADYLSTAYLPLILMAISILSLLYTAWNQIPGMNWDVDSDQEQE